jgi:hypothetical protein
MKLLAMASLLLVPLWAGLQFSLPETVSQGLEVNVAPMIDLNERGEAMVQWISHHQREQKMVVAFHNREVWGRPEVICGALQGKLGETAIRIDEEGVGYVLWHERAFPKSLLYFSEKEPGKGWLEPVSILTQEDRLKKPYFTFNSKSQPFVLTQYEKDHFEDSWVIRYQGGEKVARRFARLSSIKSVSFNRKGNGFAVWTYCQEKSRQRFSACYSQVLQAVWTEEGEKFFTPGTTIAHLDLHWNHGKYSSAVNRAKTGAVVWCSYLDHDYRVFAAAGTSKGWSEPLQVSQLTKMPGKLQVAIDDEENLVAAWIEGEKLLLAYKRHEGEWSVPQSLGEACHTFQLGYAGHFVILWDEGFVIQGAVLEEGEWKCSQLSQKGEACWAPVFAFNSHKKGVAAWMCDRERTSHIQVTNLCLD